MVRKYILTRLLVSLEWKTVTPLALQLKLRYHRIMSQTTSVLQVDRVEYQRLVGSLMHIMLGTRGDIVYAVSVASRHLANLGPQHLKLGRRIIRYLAGTKRLRLAYKGYLQILKGFTDADWAGCRDTRRSIVGYLFNLGSGAISWQSKRQNVVALSTCEAEFLGQTQATCRNYSALRKFAESRDPCLAPLSR